MSAERGKNGFPTQIKQVLSIFIPVTMGLVGMDKAQPF